MSHPEPLRPVPGLDPSEVERRRDPELTRERLLDAAERLFAERGFSGTSLRAVTQAAGTSVSAAHYHFGSKRELLVAMVLRRTEPVTRLRVERLDALAARRTVATLEDVLDAFLRPMFEARASDADGGETFRRIAARLFSDPRDVVAELKREVFGPTVGRLGEALAGALPGASPAALALGMQFLVGVMVHVASGHLEDAPAHAAGAELSALEDEHVLAEMVRFSAAGLRALVGAPEGGAR